MILADLRYWFFFSCDRKVFYSFWYLLKKWFTFTWISVRSVYICKLLNFTPNNLKVVSESPLANHKKSIQRAQNITWASNGNSRLNKARLTWILPIPKDGREHKPYDSEIHFGLAKDPIFEHSFQFQTVQPSKLAW